MRFGVASVLVLYYTQSAAYKRKQLKGVVGPGFQDKSTGAKRGVLLFTRACSESGLCCYRKCLFCFIHMLFSQ